MATYGLKLNDLIEKYMALIAPAAIIIGLIFGHHLIEFTSLVPYLFAYVTFAMAIGCSIKHMKLVVSQPSRLLLILAVIHILLPVIVYVLSGLVFGFHSPYVVGLVMFTLIPVGISSVIWVSMTGGNISLVLAIVVIDSLLSPFVITGGLRFFFHQAVQLDTASMLIDLLLIIVIPTLIGIILHDLTKGRIVAKLKPYSAPLSKVCFVIVIILNAAALTPSLEQLKGDLIKIIPLSIGIILISYFFGYLGSIKEQESANKITMTYASGIRNVSLGAVIALTYFSPQTAMPILIGILLQQPVATIVSLLLQKLNKKAASQSELTGVR